MMMLLLLLSLLYGFVIVVHAFSPALSLPAIRSTANTGVAVVLTSSLWKLHAAADAEDDEDEDEDALTDDSSLGDWRKFRASLIDAGLPTIATSQSTGDSPAGEAKQQRKTQATRKSVAAQNEALLEQQSQALALEYKTGVWCHVIQEPEVGGLLCRMPLEAELYHGSSSSTSSSASSTSSSSSSSSATESSYWKDKLRLMVSLENDNGNITTTATSILLAASSTTASQQLDDDSDDEATTEAKVKQ
jgi:hypothetical protein